MRIQHNIMAMNAYRNYNTNTKALSGNLEKLSSGYKINRAGDDAAGLAISEKMRAQITGLDAAQKNVKDGISLVKTAEGAMQEIQDMLNRMDYLATQSANGTYDDPVDRVNLQKEVDALKEEINRIADSANFNGINLLDGSQDSKGEARAAAAADAASATAVTVTAAKDHKDANDTQKMKFTVDLTSLEMSSTSSANETVTIMVHGVTLTMTVSAGSGVKTGKDISFTTAAISVGNAKFTVSLSDGIMTFEETADPTKLVSIGSAQLGQSVTVTAPANGAVNNGETIKAHIVQEEVVGGLTQLAQGSFSLTGDMVKDGARLTIGDTTYTFAVGKDSKFKDAENVVDLTDVELDAATGQVANAALTTAAIRLSGTAAGKGDFIVSNDNKSATISLTERKDAKDGPGYSDYELVGPTTTTDNDAKWTNVVKYSSTPAPSGDSGTKGLTLQIGDTADSFNQMKVAIGDMHTAAMGYNLDAKGEITTDGKSIADIDISNQKGAQDAIAVIKNAINYVSSVRGDLGAIQNRLEHTGNNLSVMAENIQDAESTIRDTDVANEMMSYVKNNILVQSAQAMLAQANQVPQGVLQLLG